MSKIKEVKQRADSYNEAAKVRERREAIQLRLIQLCDKHGCDLVAAATGYTEGTIKQYIRVTEAPMISDATITKAETILSEF